MCNSNLCLDSRIIRQWVHSTAFSEMTVYLQLAGSCWSSNNISHILSVSVQVAASYAVCWDRPCWTRRCCLALSSSKFCSGLHLVTHIKTQYHNNTNYLRQDLTPAQCVSLKAALIPWLMMTDSREVRHSARWYLSLSSFIFTCRILTPHTYNIIYHYYCLLVEHLQHLSPAQTLETSPGLQYNSSVRVQD